MDEELKSKVKNYIIDTVRKYHGKKRFTPLELEELFRKNGVTIERMYGYRIVAQFFPPGYEQKEGRMIKTGPSYSVFFNQ